MDQVQFEMFVSIMADAWKAGWPCPDSVIYPEPVDTQHPVIHWRIHKVDVSIEVVPGGQSEITIVKDGIVDRNETVCGCEIRASIENGSLWSSLWNPGE
jgi:hypothetical protein